MDMKTNTKREPLDARHPASFRRRLLPMLVTACFAGNVIANPMGPQVVNGQVGFSNQGNVLSITNTPGSIINWQSFSISPGEITRFIQQNPNSAVLNRIVGQDPSQILGALQSNGRVFLINPNGILFGQGAQVDVNGLVASTLNISNEDFLKGQMNFHAGDRAGSVKNQGAITTPNGGQVFLIAPNVENSGIITTPKGDVLLAAGRSVQLVDSKNPDLHVVVSAPTDEALNLGQVIANSGRTGIYGALVKQRGIVNANSAVVGENGKVVLKASGDTLLEAGSRTTATGAGTGGEVHVLGHRVALAGDAKIDASGQAGGGTVLVGGDYQGKNGSIQNAARTYVGKDAEIKADATVNGNGGKVVVWADETTRFDGTLSARGGAQGGNGGFAEVSGKQSLVFRGRADLGAPRGAAGNLLLDPQDIIIANGSAGADDAMASDNNVDGTDAGSGTDVTISEVALEGLSGNITLQASRDVILNDLTDNTLNLASVSGTFSVTAGRDIKTLDVNDRFQTGGGSVTFNTANGQIDIGGVKTNGGAVNMIAGGTGGNMVIREIVTTPVAIDTIGGNISLTANGASWLTLGGGNIDARGTGVGMPGNVTLNSNASINLQAGKILYANHLDMVAANGIGSGSPMETQVNSLSARNTSAGAIQISNSSTNLSIVDLYVQGYGVNQQAAGQPVLITNSAANTLGVNAPIMTAGGAVTLAGPGGLDLYAGGDISTLGGSVSLSASDAQAKIGTAVGAQIASAGGNVSLGADRMDLLGQADAGSGNITLSPQTGANAIHLGAADSAGILGLAEAELQGLSTSSLLKIGSATMTGGLSVMGNVTLSTLSGKLLLDAGTSNIVIDAPLTVPGVLSLSSTGGASTITQSIGALVSAPGGIKASAGWVTLGELNPTGIIAGTATSGNFEFGSSQLVTAHTVDGTAGINAGAGAVMLRSTHAAGVNQDFSAPIIAGAGLGVKSAGPVELTNPTNNFTKLAADLSTGTGSLKVATSGPLDISGPFTVGGSTLYGITTNNQHAGVGAGGGLIVTDAINVGTGEFNLAADSLTLNNTVTASMVGIKPVSPGRKITVGSSTCQVSPCLAVSNLYYLQAPTIGIGNDLAPVAGDIYVAGITGDGVGPDKRHISTTRIGLMTGGGISQGGVINVQDLGIIAGTSSSTVNLSTANQVTNLAVETAGAPVTFTSTGTLNIVTASGGNVTTGSDYLLDGIVTNGGAVTINAVTGDVNVNSHIWSSNGAVSLSATAGNINLSSEIDSGTGNVSLSASGNIMTGTGIPILAGPSGNITMTSSGASIGLGGDLDAGTTGIITLSAPTGAINSTGGVSFGSELNATAGGGISLTTAVSTLSALNSGISSDITISNQKPLTLNDVKQTTANSTGNISVSNSGTLTVASGKTVSAEKGMISLTAYNSMIIDGNVATTGTIPDEGNILLQAYPSNTTSGTDTLTINGTVSAVVGHITLMAGDAINGASNATSSTGTVTVMANMNPPATTGTNTPPPTLDQCTADPTLSGCTSVLPTIDSCTTNPTLAGCTAVLPTVDSCTTDPTQAGCTAVLPSLDSCTTSPTQIGCIAVLPSLTTCTTNPTQAGCTVVLPTLASCTTTPTLAGCTAVLPSVDQCTSTPTTPGCSAVPTMTSCTANPQLAGCATVLPTLETCTTNPTLAGCTAVLPALSTCTTNPTQAGCTAVLPPLSTCTTNPALAGCSAVLPSIDTCTTNPSQPGCTAVLPTLTNCTANPAQAGCTAVLPSLSSCTTNPTQAGCTAVLPTAEQCLSNSSLAGCSTVITSASRCLKEPTLPECQAVLSPNTPTTAPVTQTSPVAAVENTVIQLINTANTSSPAESISQPSGSSPSTASRGAGSSSSAPGESKQESKDEAKDERKTTAGPDDNGGQKNGPAKKMFCN